MIRLDSGRKVKLLLVHYEIDFYIIQNWLVCTYMYVLIIKLNDIIVLSTNHRQSKQSTLLRHDVMAMSICWLIWYI